MVSYLFRNIFYIGKSAYQMILRTFFYAILNSEHIFSLTSGLNIFIWCLFEYQNMIYPFRCSTMYSGWLLIFGKRTVLAWRPRHLERLGGLYLPTYLTKFGNSAARNYACEISETFFWGKIKTILSRNFLAFRGIIEECLFEEMCLKLKIALETVLKNVREAFLPIPKNICKQIWDRFSM